jgi:predicted flap endonuclease-1-like 5' DNA nuclease
VPAAALAAAPSAMPKVEGEDLIEGTRPAGLMSPRGGKADDLKLIKGIGKQNEGRLHGLGIWHFDQVAAWSKTNVDWVGSYLAFPGRIEREDWVSQAKQLATGAETEFAKRVKRGEIATSKDDGSLGQGNVAQMGEDGFEGTRPKNTLAGARGGKADDLKLINGVGRAIELKLHALGVWHFDQIAAMNDEELKFISHFSGFPGRALRENWKGEAAILAKGGETDHSRAVKAGKVPTSLNNPKKK